MKVTVGFRDFYCLLIWLSLFPFYIFSAPTTTTGGFSFGTALGTPAPTTSTTTSLGLGGSLFAQKPAGGFSFNTPATSNNVMQTHKYRNILCDSHPSAVVVGPV